MPLFASTSHPRCQLGLSRWQKQKLQKLSTQELKERNLAWVPKRDAQVQHKGDVSAFIGKRATKVNNRRRFKNKPLDQRFAPITKIFGRYITYIIHMCHQRICYGVHSPAYVVTPHGLALILGLINLIFMDGVMLIYFTHDHWNICC